MKLDKRIIVRRPLDCLDVDVAKNYIGKKGYFANNISAYQDLEKFLGGFHLWISTLRKIEDDEVIAFGDDFGHLNCYFLPEEWVLPKEKKYRPYSLNEWIEQHEIGDIIHYRNKSEGIEFRHMYMGYAFGKGKDITKINVGTVTLGVANYSFDYLFEDYKIEIGGEWLPFGVKEE